MPTERTQDPLVSIVVPVLNEQDCVVELAQRIRAALAEQRIRHELLFVDDGSSDDTPRRIGELRDRDPSVKMLRLTRSFGHQAALVAGLAHARGDAVVTMDGDLQHPPESLVALVDAWREGADVVHAVRRPFGGPAWKDRGSRLFYWLMSVMTHTPIVKASAEFRLLDRRVVDEFNALEERFVFARALVAWMGHRERQVEYETAERFAGESKYGFWRMLRLALDGLFSFSVMPLRLISLLGLATTLFGIGFGIFGLTSYFLGRVEDSGWTSVIVLILIFGGVQLLSIGILSEYVGRIYEETKRRPRYLIDSTLGID